LLKHANEIAKTSKQNEKKERKIKVVFNRTDGARLTSIFKKINVGVRASLSTF